MTHRRDPASGIWTGCAIGALIWLLLALASVSAAGQSTFFDPAPLHDAKVWCYEHGPYCEPVAHAAVTVGATGLIQWATPLEEDEARWIPVAFYVAKETYDSAIRAPGRIPWHDTALDLAGVALGVWVSDLLFGGDE